MKRRTSALLVLLAIVVVLISPLTRAQQSMRESPLKPIDDLAVKSRTGDPSSIRDLVNTIFAMKGWDDDLGSFATEVKEKLISAEIDYRAHHRDGIPVGNIVQVINDIVRSLNLPPYAGTSAYEVKKLRTQLTVSCPHLVGQPRIGDEAGADKSLANKMGPIEATWVAGNLIDHKFLFAEYQLTPAEQAARWGELHQPQPPAPGNQLTGLTQRGAEIKQSLSKALSSLGPDEASKLHDELLKALGISE